jgi:hypothetical protein
MSNRAAGAIAVHERNAAICCPIPCSLHAQRHELRGRIRMFEMGWQGSDEIALEALQVATQIISTGC